MVNTFFEPVLLSPGWLICMSLKLLASCENLAEQYYTLVYKVWCYFPKGRSVLSICSDGTEVCFFLTWIWYLLKCLPSPVGMLSLSASEASQSVCSTADSKDTFVTTHSSKASKDCPMGFADFGSVSVAYLQSIIFVCMSYWSYDVTLHIVELKAERCQSLGLILLTFHHTVTL